PRSSSSFVVNVLRPPSSPLFPYTTLFRSAISSPSRIEFHLVEETKHRVARPYTVLQGAKVVVGCLSQRPLDREPGEVEVLLDHRSEEHTSELQSRFDLVCRLLLEKKNNEL